MDIGGNEPRRFLGIGLDKLRSATVGLENCLYLFPVFAAKSLVAMITRTPFLMPVPSASTLTAP